MNIRALVLGSMVVCSIAFAACGGDDGSSPGDASIDASTPDAPSHDASTHDSAADAAPSDATPSDAADADDAADDAAQELDAPEDAISDAAPDVDYDAGGCLTNGDCASNEYCKKADGDCGGVGTCHLTPQACQNVIDPVCGCDHNTYTNFCYAERSRTNVDYAGACE